MHPLDVVKTRFQVQRGPDDPTRYKSYSDCVKKMIRNEGPLSFYKGVLPPLMAETPKRATKFFTFEQYKSLLTRNRDATAMTYIIAGTGSGITEGIMITPFERVKISLQSLRSHIRDTPGTFSHARVIISKDGFGLNGLYKELGATVWRHGVWNAIYFGFYHNMKGFFISSESPSISKRLALGTIAGTIASTANIPFDVAKSRIQGPPPNGDILKYRTTLQTIGVVFKEEGFFALYKGLLPKLMRLGPGEHIIMIVHVFHIFLYILMSLCYIGMTLSRYQLRGYHGERRGEREEMQDSHVIINDMMEQFPTLSNSPVSSVSYYGVFDGHSGSRASEFAAGNLHRVIVNKFPKEDVSAQSIKRCLVDSFKKTDSDFLSLAAKATPSWKDGSTVAIIMAMDNVLYSGNLGDSKSVMYRRSDEGDTGGEPPVISVPLTKDHTSASLEERKRIEKSGGFVREGRIMGIMEVSRSIGDGRFKGCGLIATPHVSRCELTENDLFVVVACDGLWNVFKMDEVAKFILGVVNDESIQKPGEDDRLIQGTEVVSDREYRFEVACNRLAVEAVKRGCTDNVTVLIVDIIKNNNH
ncbi:PREDICTED: uncharacterized protein LOC100637563 [Amphimedon queenslandica]|uniref:Mitochondrial 2-oxodicarboxylate carrier n=3 Tax=Amphimedon queenslandica TaxID=400682 RepID=A0AAN0IJC2_AMPQE|nr:PREDICTED: uncharacterized protein LOC100637563 [Amphimedon queenslandica]|eukprot:XP_003390974.2 PREDICTED: uncharacterized protein LOC100637563 [Amphimedon queenslandica]